MRVNKDVYRIYAMCQGQFIMGPGGVVDIDLGTVFMVMDKTHIPENEQWHISERVRALSHHMIKLAQEESEQKRQEEKLKNRR